MEDITDTNLGVKVVLLRLYNGDYIIGETIDDGVSNMIDLSNPRTLIMVPTMTGEMRMAMQTVCPFSEKAKKELSVRREQVMFVVDEDELGKELINGYKSHVTGIKIATTEETAAVNGGDLIF